MAKMTDEQEKYPEKAPPQYEAPDGGWGWMIVLASFMCNLILEGILFSYSLLLERINVEFNVSDVTGTLVFGLLNGTYLIIAPIASVLANKYGCRRVTIAGAAIAGIAFLLSFSASSFMWLLISFGLIGGIGYGFIYLPSIVIVGFWFDKKRAFAIGVSLTGGGIGMFILPSLTDYLLEEYELRGTLMIFAGLLLQCFVFGAMFRPVDAHRPKPMKRVEYIQRGSIMKALIQEKERQRTISNGSLDNCVITKDNLLIKLDQLPLSTKSNSYIERLKASLGFSSKSLNKSKNSLVIPTISVNSPTASGRSTPMSPTYPPPGEMTASSIADQGSCDSGNASMKASNEEDTFPVVHKSHSYNALPQNDPWDKLDEQPSSLNKKSLSCNNMINANTPLDVTCVKTNNGFVPSPDSGSQNSVHSTLSRRTYSNGSYASMPLCSNSVISFYGEYTDPTHLNKWYEVMKRLFDFTLLKSPTFVLLVVASFCCNFAFYIPYLFLPYQYLSNGGDETKVIVLLTVIGMANTLSRIVSGWLANRPWVNALYLFNGALLVNGIATFLCPFFTSFNILAVYAVIFGSGIAFYMSLRSVVLVDLFGLEKLNSSFGLLLLVQGIATIIGLPLLRMEASFSDNLNMTFYVSGILILVSGLLGLPLNYLKKREERQQMLNYYDYESDYTIQETLKIEKVVSIN